MTNRRQPSRTRRCKTVFSGLAILSTITAAGRTEDQTTGYLDVSGSKIYYEERGIGPAIVLLHDGLLDSRSWDEVWQALAPKYHVIRYDRRGYGRSEPVSTSFSPTGDLQKLLTHLNVPHAIIVGSSSGGALAIDFAIVHPEMVEGLFLIAPVLHGMEFSAEFGERANRNNTPMEHGDVKAWAANWSQDRFLIAGTNGKARRRIFEQLLANAEKLKNYDAGLEEKLSPPASKRLSEIKEPSLILVGDGDIKDVAEHCAAINAGIRTSERVLVKGAGHLVQLEKPNEVVKHLNDFVARCER
jgi:pimeloyl-ACP methyl ester carboxylesterase